MGVVSAFDSKTVNPTGCPCSSNLTVLLNSSTVPIVSI